MEEKVTLMLMEQHYSHIPLLSKSIWIFILVGEIEMMKLLSSLQYLHQMKMMIIGLLMELTQKAPDNVQSGYWRGLQSDIKCWTREPRRLKKVYNLCFIFPYVSLLSSDLRASLLPGLEQWQPSELFDTFLPKEL